MSYIFSCGALSGYRLLPALLVSLFVRREAMLPTFGKEATNFVRACEAIHTLLAQGPLAPDDRDIIEFDGTEILNKLRPV
jgi:hypothetical protein